MLEQRAAANATKLLEYVKKRRGMLAETANGNVVLLIGNEEIQLNFDSKNIGLARLLAKVLNIGTLTLEAKLTIQRLMVEACNENDTVHIRHFAAALDNAIFIPLSNNSVLRVTKSSFTKIANGRNPQRLFVQHPYHRAIDDTILKMLDRATAREAVQIFARLLVDTQSCANNSHRWLVAAHEGLLAFVRDEIVSRMILAHIGPSQSGKTSGAQRFVILHGLGNVKGDYTVAALGNLHDIGLLVLDNKEQGDLSRALVNFLLYLATGAERGRSDKEGNVRTNAARPIAVLTSIEGVYRDELRKRVLEVEYRRPDRYLERELIEQQIKKSREILYVGLLWVLRRYLQVKERVSAESVPEPAFKEYFRTLYALLEAYGDVAGFGPSWAAQVVDDWRASLRNLTESEEVEVLLLRAFREGLMGPLSPFTVGEVSGGVACIEASALLSILESLAPRSRSLPKTATGLARRLRSTTFKQLRVLEGRGEEPVGQRNAAQGEMLTLFFPQFSKGAVVCQGMLSARLRQLSREEVGEHRYLSSSDECFYLWEYCPRGRSEEPRPEDEVIRAMKISPVAALADRKLRMRKEDAIRRAAAALSASIPMYWRQACVFVPIPGSKPLDDPDYDDRLLKVLRLVRPSLVLWPVLYQLKTMPSLAKDLSVGERAFSYGVDTAAGQPERNVVVLVDDVLTTGAHYAAARDVIRATFPTVRCIGLFLGRTPRQKHRVASVGAGA